MAPHFFQQYATQTLVSPKRAALGKSTESLSLMIGGKNQRKKASKGVNVSSSVTSKCTFFEKCLLRNKKLKWQIYTGSVLSPTHTS